LPMSYVICASEAEDSAAADLTDYGADCKNTFFVNYRLSSVLRL